MTLDQFARVLEASPKWVLNTSRAIGADHDYSLERARSFAIARAVHEAVQLPLPQAFSLAREVLAEWTGDERPLSIRMEPSGDVSLTLDVYRLVASVNVRWSTLCESYAPIMRGRPKVKTANPLDAARDWGLDLSLLRDNLRKSPLQRLQQLDNMHAFAHTVRRGT